MKNLDSLKKLCCCAITILLFAFTNASFAQTLTTDQSDYAPGSTVTLTGSGFGSNETVTMQVLHNPTGGDDATSDAHQPWDVTSDGDGNFSATWNVPADEDEGGASLIATADGQPSGTHAEAVFTDGAQGNGVVTVSALNGSCLAYTDGNQVDNWEVAEGGEYSMTITGVTECEGDAITVFIQNSDNGNFCFTATGADGTYTGTFTMPTPSCNTSPISYKCGADQPCNQDGTFDAKGPSGAPSVHLRASTFDADCNRTGDDKDCGNTTTCNLSISSSAECSDNCPTLSVVGAPNDATYLWSPGNETTSTIQVCSPGTYSVTVTGTNCQSSAETTLEDCGGGCPPNNLEITADGDTTFCEGGDVELCASGAASYSWSGPNGDLGTDPCITVSESGTYTVTGHGPEGCNFTSEESIIVTVNPPPTVTATANGPTTFCEGGSVEICASGADSYVWSTDETTTCITVSSAGTYSVVGTDANGCTDASDDVTVTVNPNPTCNITDNNTTVVCGLSYTASVTTTPATGVTVCWSVSGTGWSIPGSKTGTSVTYIAGSGKGTLSVTVKITATGCTSTCSLCITSNCTEGCSYTQGFYGGTGKNCQQVSAAGVNGVIASALSQGPLKTGTTGHSICFGTTEAACLGSHMPSGTTPSQLPAGDKTCATATGSSYLNGGKYKSVLLGQVIALGLNMRNTSNLGSIVINGKYVTTYKATSCSSGVAKPGTKLVKGPIPASIFTALGSSFTVSQLWTAANNALGNGSTTPSLSDWTSACDIINNAFDGCRILAGFGSSSSGLKGDEELDPTSFSTSSTSLENMSIYPNPAVDQVNVSFTSASEMNATVDIYNVNGVLMTRIETGVFGIGESSVVRLDASQLAQGVYFVRISQGDKSANGKFILVK